MDICREWHLDRVEEFGEFLTERREVWHRRFPQKLPPPFSQNEILQKYHFCNIYRGDDYVSQWITANILGRADMPFSKILFNDIGARLFNEPKTLKVLGFMEPTFDATRTTEILLERQARGMTVFRRAYRIGMAKILGEGGQVKTVVNLLALITRDLKAAANAIREANGLHDAHKILVERLRVPPFAAYQTALDIAGFFDWDMSAWAYIGPGAVGGLNYLLKNPLRVGRDGSLDAWENKRAIEYCRVLASDQDAFLESREFRYPLNEDGSQKLLTANDFEHCCCEFRKYLKIKNGGSHRLFKPRDMQAGPKEVAQALAEAVERAAEAV